MKIQPLSWYGKIAASTAALLLLASSTYAITLAQLQNDIDYVINTSNSNVSWSVKIENNAGNGDLYSKNSTTMRRPASNTKIFTAAAAFRKFGPSYVWQGYQLGSSSTISPIDQILSDSNNSQADSLFSLIGGESAALAQLSNITSTAGMDMNDGSGLNYGNRFNNEQTIDVLRWARNTYTFNQFISLGNQLHLSHAWWQIVWNRKIWSCTR